MLRWRLAVSATVIPVLFLLFWWDHRIGSSAPVFLVISQLLLAGCVLELVRMLRARFTDVETARLLACAGLVALSAWIKPGLEALSPTMVPDVDTLACSAIVLIGVWLLLLARAVFSFRAESQNTLTIAAESLVLLYVGMGICLTANLRWVAGAERGYLVLGSMIVAVKMGDVGGYTIGRLFGHRKFIPRLSPGKTWAGVYGAMSSAVLVSLFWLGWISTAWFGETTLAPHWERIVLYGLVMGAAGIVGDLAESLIKRDAGVKDSGNTIPGFGGVLDLMDSLLFAGPLAYLFWRFFPPLG
ncbi:MAG: phosphatidate cytidylyltransferase [Planctomycetaceae bacterium]